MASSTPGEQSSTVTSHNHLNTWILKPVPQVLFHSQTLPENTCASSAGIKLGKNEDAWHPLLHRTDNSTQVQQMKVLREQKFTQNTIHLRRSAPYTGLDTPLLIRIHVPQLETFLINMWGINVFLKKKWTITRPIKSWKKKNPERNKPNRRIISHWAWVDSERL